MNYFDGMMSGQTMLPISIKSKYIYYDCSYCRQSIDLGNGKFTYQCCNPEFIKILKKLNMKAADLVVQQCCGFFLKDSELICIYSGGNHHGLQDNR